MTLLALALAGCGGGGGGGDAPDGGGVVREDGGGSELDAQVTPSDGSTERPDGSTSSGALTCTTGTLLAGHPEHDAEPGVHANDGDPLRGVEGRPLGWREVIFVGDRMVTVVGREVWATDLSEASPTVRRIAGRDGAGQQLLDGPCATARFANLQDLAADAEGSLYVMDQTGNAVLKITDPFEASCEVHYWAGTSVDTLDITPVTPPNVGNTEGPGATAQFALPGRMAIDEAGNLYVWDEGNTSIRRIANDAAHTVSTLAEVESVYDGRSQDVIVDSMLVLDGALYLYAHDTAGQVIIERVALSDGAKSDVLRGRPDVFPGFGSSASLQVGGMTTDGEELFVYFKGLIFGVTLDGTTRKIAGNEDARSTIEFETGYDPTVPHGVDELHLANRSQYATAGADSWLAIDDENDLYFVGSVLDPYVVRIACD